MVAGHFPVTHSVLSSKALIEKLHIDYEIAEIVDCQLYARGSNDTYLVKTDIQPYVLRVYTHEWRSISEIHYELAAINHLASKGLSVAAPIANRKGSFIFSVNAPEGERHAVLFQYASGREIVYSGDAADSYGAFEYGRAVALVHKNSADFRSDQQRFSLDTAHLIDEPIANIRPLLKHRPNDMAKLENLAGYLKQWLEQNASYLESGFCHGDFHGGNAHIYENDITFFDFDCCGNGWRAYDSAVVRWSARLAKSEDRLWPEYLRGYNSVREMEDADLKAIEMFIAIRHIWLMGFHTGHSPLHGRGWMNDNYFDRQLGFLREWETEFIQAETSSNNS